MSKPISLLETNVNFKGKNLVASKGLQLGSTTWVLNEDFVWFVMYFINTCSKVNLNQCAFVEVNEVKLMIFKVQNRIK